MKSWTHASAAALAVICIGALAVFTGKEARAEDHATPKATSPESVYVKMDYMKLSQATPREYFEVELGEWRAIQEQRIRAGVTTAWYFYEKMPGAYPDDDQDYHYITVSVFDSHDKVFDPAGTEAIFQVYPGVELQDVYDRADSVRDFVRSDLWQMTEVISPYTQSKPKSPYLTINYFDTREGSGEHLDLESNEWAGIHKERIRRGVLNSGGLFLWQPREGETRAYDYATIDYYDHLDHLRVPVNQALVQAAHPEMSEDDVTQLFHRTGQARAVHKSQLWRLIDAIEGPLEEE